MNEGIGSTTILVIIVVFIALVSGYMAYNVNYTKAFRMKNKIISDSKNIIFKPYNLYMFCVNYATRHKKNAVPVEIQRF